MIGLLRGNQAAETIIRELEGRGESLSTTVLTLYELLKGALASSRPEENQLAVTGLVSGIPLLTMTEEASINASKIFAELKTGGKIIGELDILIAAIVISNSETLLSRDEHFKSIPRLDLRAW